MVRCGFRTLAISAALLAGLALGWPAAAAAAGDYTVVGATQARGAPAYLTLEAVTAKLKPAVAAQLPAAADARLVILSVAFRATGDTDKMVRLDPGELQLQWDVAGGGRGSAPVLGVHVSKDFMPRPGTGFYTSMRPDKYDLFAILPKAVRQVDLAQRQADGAFTPVRTRITLAAPRN